MKADQKVWCVLFKVFLFYNIHVINKDVYEYTDGAVKNQTYLPPLYSKSFLKARYLMVAHRYCLPSRTLTVHQHTDAQWRRQLGGKKGFKNT
jgi:hypothetical protein